MHPVKWNRIILDEAHMIRNHKNARSKNACKLDANFYWCLTGTPIQNERTDAFAMFRFLRFQPYCNLRSFNRNFKNDDGGVKLGRYLQPILLRRTKDDLMRKGELANLVPKTFIKEDIDLTIPEIKAYEKLLAQSKKLYAKYELQHKPKYIPKKNEISVKHMEIMALWVRLRQVCVHPRLIDSVSFW